MSGVFLNDSPFDLRQGLSLNTELAHVAGLAGQVPWGS